MRHLRFVLAIVIMLTVVVLLVENYEAFSQKVFFRLDLFSLHYQSAPISMYNVVAVAFLLGVLVAGFYGMLERFRLLKRIRTLVNTAKEKDKELNSLRNLPITSDNVGSDHLTGLSRSVE